MRLALTFCNMEIKDLQIPQDPDPEIKRQLRQLRDKYLDICAVREREMDLREELRTLKTPTFIAIEKELSRRSKKLRLALMRIERSGVIFL